MPTVIHGWSPAAYLPPALVKLPHVPVKRVVARLCFWPREIVYGISPSQNTAGETGYRWLIKQLWADAEDPHQPTVSRC